MDRLVIETMIFLLQQIWPNAPHYPEAQRLLKEWKRLEPAPYKVERR